MTSNDYSFKYVYIPWVFFMLFGAGCESKKPVVVNDRVHYVIGVSPFLDDSVKDTVYQHIVGFLLEDMPLNSSLSLYDAYHIKTITQIDIPNVGAFRSSKTRANQFKDPIQKLKKFLAMKHDEPSDSPFDLDQAIRFPQFMDFVGENLTGPEHSIILSVLGGPLYLDDREPDFSMVNGYFPSDGHLLATRDKSVYGLQSRAGALQDINVHLCYFGNPWVSEIHQEKIGRFWTLFLKQQGGRLATFCGDIPTMFNAICAGTNVSDTRNRRHEIDSEQTKIEMLRITRKVGLADWLMSDVSGATRPPAITKGPMKIGIRWKGDIDLDLYARPANGGEMLFFEHTQSPEGYYFKDHRSSPDREYEFIDFAQPVEIHQVEAMINLYEGDMPGGPEGEIRIEFDGRIYVDRFSLDAERGNQGRAGSSQKDFWTRIDIPGVLKLEEN